MSKISSAFTLVETLVAVAIAAALLGSSLISSRVVRTHIELSEDAAQMNALADSEIAIARTYVAQKTTTGLPVVANGVAVVPSSTTQANSFHFQIKMLGSPTYDIVALARNPSTTTVAGQRSSNNAQTAPSGDFPSLTDTANWTFYKVSLSYIGSPSITFNADDGHVVSNPPSLQNPTTRLVVVVSNLNNPQSQITRTTYLSAWQP